ncbi:PREDICTED: endothelin-converting enzyme 2-like [Branchiostoma belcheri]|uniref:Endothelin-converting enzyme 2-like n=1 Tax=Branchiostoma belcheri TaxID=7741 RepID=A0A6P4Z294_BRABE|nr:PREDICTED: endothelin-converting enzyme 2-like [Branchiostoma belcheri]
MATATDVSYEKHNDDVENIVPEFGPSPKPTDGGSSKMWTLPVVTSLGLTRRELVIGGCLVGLMVIVLILAVVLGVLAARQATPLVVDVPCSDAGCLQATSQLLQNLNTSAKPCDDFYSYACGGWMLTHPIAPADLERTVHLDVYNQNAEKIRRLLDTPVAFSDTLADQKVPTLPAHTSLDIILSVLFRFFKFEIFQEYTHNASLGAVLHIFCRLPNVADYHGTQSSTTLQLHPV